MKNYLIIAAFFLAVIVNVHNAAAFSTEYDTSQNSAGSSKLLDPDEQIPGFILGPNGAQIKDSSLSDNSPAVTVPTVGENDSGARAFDRAFSHQEDK